MQTVFPPNNAVLALLGAPKQTEEALRLTRWCIRLSCDSGTLLYNTLTGELLLLPAAEDTDQNRAVLRQKHFLVPESLDEFARARDFKRILCLMQPKTAVDCFLIYPTTECNARCYYCYEFGRPKMTMSDRTADETADYILRVSGDSSVNITWFGGEPLFNSRAIDRITDRLRRVGKPFRSSMISNGYLFDADLVETAVQSWKLHEIQVPLDGTEAVYNRAKAFQYRDDPSPFRRVMRNISLLLDAGVTVSVRLNLGAENYEDIKSLIGGLDAAFRGRGNLRVYVGMLRDFGTAPQDSVNWEERLRRWVELSAALSESGFRKRFTLKKKPNVFCCMADSDNAVTILPDGSLGRCEHEDLDESVGNICDGVLDPARVAAWKENVEVADCRECALFPRCRRLKKCAWTKGTCEPLDRALFFRRLEDEILYTYETGGRECQSEDTDDAVC